MTIPETAQSPAAGTATGQDPELTSLVSRLDLETKVSLLTGSTAWRLRAIDEIGLRSVVMSDGPAGVRGTGEQPGETSISLPSPSALAATWDLSLAAEVGSLFAAEARQHGVDMVLAPQVNIQRTPVAGRHFECYSEDPLLTTMISGAVIRSMQDGGVASCLKHFVANDSETDRTTYLSTVDERTLREVYLAPFEHAVRDVGVWSVMAAYNQVDDGVQAAPATEHDHLLRDVLKDEWHFDGVVVSDWLATRRTVESATGGLDVVMPGPGGPWEDQLVAAVRDGRVPESLIDDKVLRVLTLARRTGALDRPARSVPPVDPGLPRRLAARATVVLRNSAGVLPLTPARLRRVALIGPNAVSAFVQGGGSAHVTPDHEVTPADGLRAALPHADITVLRGGDARRHAPDLEPGRCTDPSTGAQGVRVTRLAIDGGELGSSVVPAWAGWDRPLPPEVADVRLETIVHLPEPGEHLLELGSVGRWRFELDGDLVASGGRSVGAEVILDSSINSPDGSVAAVEGPRDVRLVATVQVVRGSGLDAQARAALRHRGPGQDTDAEIEAAVRAAADADAVVIVVGTNDEVESEGWDRTDLALPGRQDELVARVLDVAPDAVVVVNAGAPVLLPWLERARTVLWTWFPGQDCGAALADVLTGVTEPAGRLPWTLPAREQDVPVPHARPVDGRVVYSEGVHVGHRSWLRSGARPAVPFGHGLGWTTWTYGSVSAARAPDGGIDVTAEVTNTGARLGTEVVQVYLEPPAGGGLDRPVRWLAGFATVTVEPGEQTTAHVRVSARALQIWDVERHAWGTPPGTYRLRIGRSVDDLRLAVPISVPFGNPGTTTCEVEEVARP